MNDQIRYFRFVAQFVDAVTTEPLAQALRKRDQPVRLRDRVRDRMPDVQAPLPRAA